ncbi:MAG: saccharopine dehydrogenase NADP-binding domain-containing protein [Acetobacteraceae bacterium]
MFSADGRGSDAAAAHGIQLSVLPITRANYRTVLADEPSLGDFPLNLSVDVSSVALIGLCCDQDTLYLDTCIEPWASGYTDPSFSVSGRSNYALRESAPALALALALA